MGDQGVTLKPKPTPTLTQEEISKMNSEEINQRLERLGVFYTRAPKSIFEKQENQNIVKMTAELAIRLSHGERVKENVEKGAALLAMQVPIAKDLAEALRSMLKRLTGDEYKISFEGGKVSMAIKKGDIFQPIISFNLKEVTTAAKFHINENLDFSVGASFSQKSPTATASVSYGFGGSSSSKTVQKQITILVPLEMYEHISKKLTAELDQKTQQIKGVINKDNIREITQILEAEQAKGKLAPASVDAFKYLRENFSNNLNIALLPQEPVCELSKSIEAEISRYLSQDGIRRSEKENINAVTTAMATAGTKPRKINKLIKEVEKYGTARFVFLTGVPSDYFDIAVRPFELAKGPRTR